jgi:alpha-amylase/alpha-mannosidase (GH57 family)
MIRADVIFHGHFYQPPRENPWTGVVEREWSAEPFHDWNQRIDHECYAANAASPVYDQEGRVEEILDNYDRISFNFGPTLLSWLEQQDPRTLERILAADRRSVESLDGHGNAIAQVYNHVILPLADARDRRTQIRWGLREFEHRFHRSPEGMWLAETAANEEVLDELAAAGMRFVILAPRQASRFRARGEKKWNDASSGIDPSRAYLHRPRRSRKEGELAVFFYDGALAANCSFGKALADGRILADAFEKAFDPSRDHRQLLHVAVDGETAGHHVQWGNLALSWALARELEERGFRLTNYGRYLEENPPEWEVELALGPLGEGTSWSCAHGVGRWIRDCGCRAAPHQATSQAWRTPLRQALDVLRDRSRELYVAEMTRRVKDVWAARDEYVEILLDESPAAREQFWKRHAVDAESEPDAATWTLLEMQHLAQLMYTSCGWFFDDISGLESVQILRYAARALELFEELDAKSPREEFLRILEAARSNEVPARTGREIFERDVVAARVTAERIVAHLAMSAILGPPASNGRLGFHRYQRQQFHVRQRGDLQLATGHFVLEHLRTGRGQTLEVAMLHRGGLEFTAAVRDYDEAHFAKMQEALHSSFEAADDRALQSRLDEFFSLPRYGAEDLLEPERQEILGRVFASVTDEFADSNARLYEQHRSLISNLRSLGFEIPEEVAATVGFALRRRLESRLEALLDAWEGDPQRDEEIHEVLEEVRALRVGVASPDLSRHFAARIELALRRQVEVGESDEEDDPAEGIEFALKLLDKAKELGLELDLRRSQVLFFERILPTAPESWPRPWSRLRELLRFSPHLEVQNSDG